MIKLSASSIIEADHGCPTKTHKKYVLKKEEAPTGIYGSFGRALHNTISTTIDFGQINKPEMIQNQWEEDYLKIFKKETQGLSAKGNMKELGADLLSNWGQDMVQRGWDKMKPLMMEKYCLHKLTEEITMSGYIDIVFELEGKIYLVDWKSQTKYPSQYELDTSIQLSTYAWFLNQAGITPDYICLYMLRGNKPLYTQRREEDTQKLAEKAFDQEVKVQTAKENMKEIEQIRADKALGITGVTPEVRKELSNFNWFGKDYIPPSLLKWGLDTQTKLPKVLKNDLQQAKEFWTNCNYYR